MGKHPYDSEHKAGDHNLKKYGLDIHHPVFPFSAMLIIGFIVFTLLAPTTANELLHQAKSSVIDIFDVFFMFSANLFVVFILILALSPLGKLRIGGVKSKAEYTNLSWFAMLFSAGMGIGLMFWSVAEPLAYASGWLHTPLDVAANSEEAKAVAMAATLYHWTIHPWAIYALVGLSLAFFYHTKKLPLTLRSVFYPLFSERIWGWPGHIIDILAVVATMFGLATSLGLGAQQAASGMHFLFGLENGLNLQIVIIICISLAAVVSVFRGLDGGIKVLANMNVGLAFCLMSFVFFAGPTTEIIRGIVNNIAYYAEYLLPLSEIRNRTDTDWQHSWTVFYWAWWISWSPFVGMFIARISKGRTVREFILAVLVVPSIVTLIWMSTFGDTAIYQYSNGIGELANGVSEVSHAMFSLLEVLPISQISSFFAIILVLIFFITSADSGSLVVDSITSGGKIDSPVVQRVFWVLAVGSIAMVLLIGGGEEALKSLQAGAISAGLPFTFVLLLMSIALLKGLFNEHRQLKGLDPILPPDK